MPNSISPVHLVCPHCQQKWDWSEEQWRDAIAEQRNAIRCDMQEVQEDLITLAQQVYGDVPEPPNCDSLLFRVQELAGHVALLNQMRPDLAKKKLHLA